MTDHPLPDDDAIAIVGMAGTLPGAADLDGFWDDQLQMRSGIRDLTPDQMRRNGRTDADLARRDLVGKTASIADVDRFDAPFFGFTAREAQVMDPQIRLMHQLAWHVLENGGCDPRRTQGRIGVFATTHMSTYWLYNMAGIYRDAEPNALLQIAASNGQDYPATTVAYRLGLTGPALNIHTACSSSLVALATACQNLMDGSCDAALALAVSVTLPQDTGYLASAESIYSPDGICRPFDTGANGTVAGDGSVGVLLRRLSDAQADGCRILGVIRGWAVNNDGQRKIGFTAPSTQGQQEVLRDAANVAGIEPGDLDYLETHGTGTTLGDPIEVQAIRAVHGAGPGLALGSVKAAIGHLGGAAGLAGLARTVLGLHHNIMPGTLHFRSLSPQIDLSGSNITIQDQPRPFPQRNRPRRAGVSSFGIGGTNAHVVLESHAAPTRPAPSTTPEALGLSAPDAEGAERRRLQMIDWLERGRPPATETAFPDAATLSDTSILHLPAERFRLAVSGADAPALAQALRQAAPAISTPNRPRLCMVFTGSGVPSGVAGRFLADSSPAFADALDRIEALLKASALPSARDWLFRDDTDERQLVSAHLAAFAFGYAQAAMWRAAGLHPDAVIGHSMGEIAAACRAGAIDLPDALDFVATRAQAILSHARPGELLVAAAAPDALSEYLGQELELAGDNGLYQTLIAGPAQHIQDLKAALSQAGIPAAIPPAGQAFHSRLMAATAGPVSDAAQRFGAATIPVCSTVTGQPETDLSRPGHWAAQMTQPIRLQQAIAAAVDQGCTTFLELGPRPTLTVGGARALRALNPDAAWICPMAGLGGGDLARSLADARAGLFTAGFATQPPHRAGRMRTSLPPYPFARHSYWIAPQLAPARAEPTVQSVEDVPTTHDNGEDMLRDHLAALWCQELGLAHVADHDSFLSRGGSSLAALRLIGGVEASLGVRPSVSTLVQDNSFAGFVAAVADLLIAEQAETAPEEKALT